jgi:hypothetical protein
MTTKAGRGPTALSKAPEPEEIDRTRSLWCPVYENCLGLALRAGWRSWTCGSCALFHEAGPHRNRAAAHSFHARPGAGSADGAPRPVFR